jgi:hypothetical protein
MVMVDKSIGKPMSSPLSNLEEAVWELPPLILYPFNEHLPPSTLLDSSKAALMLSGLVPDGGSDQEELRRRMLAGRYAEIRMLFFLGKDVLRWIEQCTEMVERTPGLRGFRITGQSFAGLLTGTPPEAVKSKLIAWGVADYTSIFSRGIGLHSIFTAPPSRDLLATEFLCSYHRYADAMYQCYMQSQSHRSLSGESFHFDLYASGEYSQILEMQWGEVDQSRDR